MRGCIHAAALSLCSFRAPTSTVDDDDAADDGQEKEKAPAPEIKSAADKPAEECTCGHVDGRGSRAAVVDPKAPLLSADADLFHEEYVPSEESDEEGDGLSCCCQCYVVY